MRIEDLETAAKLKGFTFRRCTPFHVQVRNGNRVVNVWLKKNSKAKWRCYVQDKHGLPDVSRFVSSIEEVIRLAITPTTKTDSPLVETIIRTTPRSSRECPF